jgi:hypothetical protein
MSSGVFCFNLISFMYLCLSINFKKSIVHTYRSEKRAFPFVHPIFSSHKGATLHIKGATPFERNLTDISFLFYHTKVMYYFAF